MRCLTGRRGRGLPCPAAAYARIRRETAWSNAKPTSASLRATINITGRPGSFLSGLLFGAGLVVAGMSKPAKVLAFLDITGDWDPTLALVMAAALAVYLPVAQWRLRAQGPAW